MTSAVPIKPLDRAAEAQAVLETAGLDYPRGSRNSDGQIVGPPRPVLSNVISILEADPHYKGRASFDAFRQRIQWREARANETADDVPLADHHLDTLRDELGQDYRMHVTADVAHQAIRRVAKINERHPVREALAKLPPWDRVDRLAGLLPRYLGAADTPLNREIGTRWAISAVARILAPGCKVDTTLVLQGPQGCGKSTWVQMMALRPAWFSDTPLNLGDKDAFIGLQGVWLYEIGELAATRKKDVEIVKAFLTAQSDRVRLPYDKCTTDLPRQNVFVGTTNEEQFLTDSTGARRFWPVRVKALDRKALAADLAQLWAQALYLYRDARPGSVPWLLPPEVAAELAERHEEHSARHPWEDALDGGRIERLTNGQAGLLGFTCSDLLLDLGVELQHQSRSQEMILASLLKARGYERRKVSAGKSREWRYFPAAGGGAL